MTSDNEVKVTFIDFVHKIWRVTGNLFWTLSQENCYNFSKNRNFRFISFAICSGKIVLPETELFFDHAIRINTQNHCWNRFKFDWTPCIVISSSFESTFRPFFPPLDSCRNSFPSSLSPSDSLNGEREKEKERRKEKERERKKEKESWLSYLLVLLNKWSSNLFIAFSVSFLHFPVLPLAPVIGPHCVRCVAHGADTERTGHGTERDSKCRPERLEARLWKNPFSFSLSLSFPFWFYMWSKRERHMLQMYVQNTSWLWWWQRWLEPFLKVAKGCPRGHILHHHNIHYISESFPLSRNVVNKNQNRIFTIAVLPFPLSPSSRENESEKEPFNPFYFPYFHSYCLSVRKREVIPSIWFHLKREREKWLVSQKRMRMERENICGRMEQGEDEGVIGLFPSLSLFSILLSKLGEGNVVMFGCVTIPETQPSRKGCWTRRGEEILRSTNTSLQLSSQKMVKRC